MPRVGQAYYGVSQNNHTQVTSTGTGNVQTITLETGCSAFLVSARTNSGFLTFNGSTPSSSNGLELPAGTNPVLIPLGWHMHSGRQVKWASSVAGNAILNLQQLS